ncbi:hypothetical protein [Ectobacillus polymachus]
MCNKTGAISFIIETPRFIIEIQNLLSKLACLLSKSIIWQAE